MSMQHLVDGMYQPKGTHTYELVEIIPEYTGDRIYKIRCTATQYGWFSKKPKTVVGYICRHDGWGDTTCISQVHWTKEGEARRILEMFRNHRPYKETVICSYAVKPNP